MKKTITVLLAAILTLGPAASRLIADELVLEGGDTLTGRILEQNDDTVVIEHPVLGKVTVPRSQVTAMTQDSPYDLEAVVRNEADAAAAEAAAEAEKARLWHLALTLAGTAKAGQTDSQTLTVGLKIRRETEKTRLTWDTLYFYDASDGDRTDNKLTTQLLHEWLRPGSPWGFFASGQYDYDEFNSWEYRVMAHGGVSYDLYNTDKFFWQLFGGLGAIREFNSPNDNVRPEALIGTRVRWQISDKQELSFATTLFPDLDDTGEYRWVTRADWSTLLSEELNLSLVIGVLNEYESKVDPGTEHYDFRAIVGLSLEF